MRQIVTGRVSVVDSSTVSTLRGWSPVSGVALQLGQVVEGVGAAQLTGVNQAHEQVAHLPPFSVRWNKTFFLCRTALFNALSTMLLSSGGSRFPQEQSQRFQCRNRYVMALPKPECRARGRGRHGRGLLCARYAARPNGGDQDSAGASFF
jgi:hypothetical protein